MGVACHMTMLGYARAVVWLPEVVTRLVRIVHLIPGDCTHLVHCKGRPRGQARARAGARGWTKRAKRDRSLLVREEKRVAPCITTSAARARLGIRLGEGRD